MKVYQNITELIGNTPLLKLNNLEKALGLEASLFVKIEAYNPAGSVKDRIAYSMIKDAEERNIINKDTVIIEPTSGNTGIGLAAICAAKGYKAIFVMPDTMSIERRKLLKAYGAELVLTPGSEGMKGAIRKANELAESIGNAFIPSQFENPANPKIHYETTGPEIYRDLEGKVDIFISGIGTGGTISGAGKYLKSKNPNLKVIGIEPTDSPVITQGVAGSHKIQGIGAGFIPKTLDTNIYDEIITVANEDAFKASRMVAKLEGLLVGISSGAAIHTGIMIAEREENKGKNIVIILPDTGERYLSTQLFIEE
ncbi:MAG TPA: cysteine synthase A [Acholeplasmataceae bacterium]|jgi:cysteine synthase A|nr:cysteine synthase A [Acholeplasmataceae bacterium]